MRKYFAFFTLISLFIIACRPEAPRTLPILGERDVVNGDTIYHKIPAFSFINQDNEVVNNYTFKGKVYVVDFFFTSCPTICPKVTRQMLRVYEKFKDNNEVMLLAHTIDVKHDSTAVLRNYANKLGVSTKKWLFVTGEESSVYKIANAYFSIASRDPNAPGGFDHSGRLVLVDKNRLVRSFCDGTDEKDVDRFMTDIELLLKK